MTHGIGKTTPRLGKVNDIEEIEDRHDSESLERDGTKTKQDWERHVRE